MPRVVDSSSVDRWIECLRDFDEVVSGHPKKGPGLVELERWWLQLCSPASPKPNIDRNDLMKLIDWKGKRGKFRPALVAYARDQHEAALKTASAAAYKLLAEKTSKHLDQKTLTEALNPLLELRGIGPATASAVLAAYDDRVMFMSDELLEELHGKREYTLKSYIALFDELQGIQKTLMRGEDARWLSLRDMERAVFVDVLRRRRGDGDVAGKKRNEDHNEEKRGVDGAKGGGRTTRSKKKKRRTLG